MDLTISVPQEVSEEARKVADEMSVSLEQLFTLALYQYLSAYRGELLTEVLDTIYARERSAIDPVLARMQIASLEREDW